MKTIVILSTEPWGKVFLSKMHFALVLAKQGNRVYFVNPPRPSVESKTGVDLIHPNIYILQPKAITARRFLINKAFLVYELISFLYARKLKSEIGHPIDELWAFNPHVYVNLKSFGAKKTMLLLYDFYQGKHIKKVADSADVLISVSQIILDHYSDSKPPKLLLHHGLSEYFERQARNILEKGQYWKHSNVSKLKIGYTGNLLIKGLEIKLMQKIIRTYADVEFHFWGPYSINENNVLGDTVNPENIAFIEFLQNCKNVFLHGITSQENLPAQLLKMDAFFMCYSPDKGVSKASNSHKIMEFLSTGRVIVSTPISNFAGTDYFVMNDLVTDDFEELFGRTIKHLDEHNSVDKQQKRIEFALSNTYKKQIERIEEFVQGIKG